MKRTLVWVSAVGLLVSCAQAAEMRTWMSRKGGTIEAQFLGVQGDSVSLISKDSRRLDFKIEDLSLADRQHLVEVGGPKVMGITSGKPGLVEKEVKIDTSTFKPLTDRMNIPGGPPEGIELLETPHFLIGVAGKVRPQAIAETAERLWYGMAFQHMTFRQDWGDKRTLILLMEDRPAFTALGKWFANVVAGMGNQDAAAEVAATWDKVGSNHIIVTEEMAAKHNINRGALVFNVVNMEQYRKDLSSFPTHTIASMLIGKQMGNVSSYGSEGYFAISTGHAYYKEISLAGKSETHLITVGGSGKDEISSKAGFADGTSWSRTLRSLVKAGKVKVELPALLKWKGESLTPERLVLIYSLSHYMQGDTKRLAAFTKMIRRIETTNQVPEPVEIARIFGFDTVEAFEADWTKFIKEGDFK